MEKWIGFQKDALLETNAFACAFFFFFFTKLQ